jgi:hypothetical protein
MNKKSLFVCIFCLLSLVTIRILTTDKTSKTWVNVISWDAMGYYLYLPGIFIYDDVKTLDWYSKIDSEYHPTGNFYQAHKLKNGNFVMKYLMGISILYSPFVFVAHILCPYFHYPQDGFSVPYQLALCFALIFYAFIGLLFLRKVLLNYFDDTVTAISLLLMVLATNFLQYTGVESGMTHGYLFALYAIQLFVTIKWYNSPKWKWAFLSGYLIGLATITRPTDATMLLIPLLWNEYSKESSVAKWKLVKEKWRHVLIALLGGFLGIIPQLIYWKYVTGHWVYDVGSKWVFLNPFWRVLFGFEKGWFIYTPITVFFVLGLFFLKDKVFKRTAIVFFLINTWIIISWFDWKYGGSYSCRALLQGCAVLILPFAASVEWSLQGKKKFLFIPIFIYLTLVNIFQLYQYNIQIIHYDLNTRKYYSAIYLNPNPTALDASLLDTDERLEDETGFQSSVVFFTKDTSIVFESGTIDIATVPLNKPIAGKTNWLKIELEGVTTKGLWQSYLISQLEYADSIRTTKVRLHNEINKEGKETKVMFYQNISDDPLPLILHLKLESNFPHNTKLHFVKVSSLTK